MTQQTYVYNRSDFRPLPVKLEHMNIWLSFGTDQVEASGTLRITARKPLRKIELDAWDLEILGVEWVANEAAQRAARAAGKETLNAELPTFNAQPRRGGVAVGIDSDPDADSETLHPPRSTLHAPPAPLLPPRGEPLTWTNDAARHKLVVRLPKRIAAGQTFTLATRVRFAPSDSILEGIYKDTTPPGCPQQYMSQCQQWGFQHILPVFDDCTAKCTMITTLEADARYTHLISNGNISKALNPGGKPVPKPGDPARQVITYENFIPMPPYLFIACAGTWDAVEDEVVYPSGRRVKLEYLVPPGRAAGAALPMKILKESVLWQGRTQNYEYARDVYRTICMEKSDYGGMENVGNTTIITEAALIDEWIGDRRIEYAHGVIVHEFEHSQCGSDVTMETPFDMWLNEAYTVDVEREFSSTLFNPVCLRLDAMDVIRSPLGGPLVQEDAGHAGRIVRKGFDTSHDLVDGITYTKGAEVIRMLRLIIGPESFRRGADLYFARYNGTNANSDQFLACFEEVSGRNLTQFKRQWLFSAGYPRITAAWSYDDAARRLRMDFRQARSGRGGPFHVPVDMAAVAADGRDIQGTARVVEITGKRLQVELDCPAPPAFVSLNRDGSFYGTFRTRGETRGMLVAQIRTDPDLYSRVEALRRLTDRQRIRLLRDADARISPAWIAVFGEVLRDRSLPPAVRSHLLRIDELSLERKYVPCYRERYAARRRLQAAIATRDLATLVSEFDAVDTYRRADDPRAGLDERKLKAALLRLIVEAGTPEAYRIAEEHFRRAWNVSDKLAAIACISASCHPVRRDLLRAGLELWKDHLGPYSSYLQTVGAGIHDDVFDMIAEEEQRPCFRSAHPSHVRSLYMPMASNNKMLWTDRGLQWMEDTIVRLSGVNPMIPSRMIECFQMVDKLAADLKPKVVAALENIVRRLEGVDAASVTGRARSYLQSEERGGRS